MFIARSDPSDLSFFGSETDSAPKGAQERAMGVSPIDIARLTALWL